MWCGLLGVGLLGSMTWGPLAWKLSGSTVFARASGSLGQRPLETVLLLPRGYCSKPHLSSWLVAVSTHLSYACLYGGKTKVGALCRAQKDGNLLSPLYSPGESVLRSGGALLAPRSAGLAERLMFFLPVLCSYSQDLCSIVLAKLLSWIPESSRALFIHG